MRILKLINRLFGRETKVKETDSLLRTFDDVQQNEIEQYQKYKKDVLEFLIKYPYSITIINKSFGKGWPYNAHHDVQNSIKWCSEHLGSRLGAFNSPDRWNVLDLNVRIEWRIPYQATFFFKSEEDMTYYQLSFVSCQV